MFAKNKELYHLLKIWVHIIILISWIKKKVFSLFLWKVVDYCYDLCNLADSFVEGYLSSSDILKGGINRRLYYFYKVLNENNYQSDRNHPFVRDIVNRMNTAKAFRLSDRLLLSVSSRKAIRICLFLSKFIRRMENPIIIINDVKRICKRWYGKFIS